MGAITGGPFRERLGRSGVVARLTGLEPATPGVTGRYSNQLSYNRVSTRPDRRPSVGCVICIPRPPVKRPRHDFRKEFPDGPGGCP